MAVTLALLVRANPHGGDMRLVAHLPESGTAHDLLVAAQHEIVGGAVVMELAIVGIARAGCRKDLALDRLHLGDVLLAHGIDERSGFQLHHGAFLLRSSAAAG